MFVRILFLIFVTVASMNLIFPTNARDILLKSMSSAEIEKIDKDANKFNPEHSFVSSQRKKPKTKKHVRTMTTVDLIDDDFVKVTTVKPKKKTVTKKIKKHTTKLTQTIAASVSPATTVSKTRPTTTVKSLSFPTLSTLPSSFSFLNPTTVKAFLMAAQLDAKNENTEIDINQQLEETAPPADYKRIEFKSEDDLVKQLNQTEILRTDNINHKHEGGNVKRVNFEDALKVTVPYENVN